MKVLFLKFCLVLSLCAFSQQLLAAEFMATNSAELRKYVAKAKPGDVVVMKAGRWNNQKIKISGKGSEGKPITVRAEVPGKTVLTGNSYLHVSGEYIAIEGLRFSDGYLKQKGHVIRLEGSHHRVTNTAITNYNPPSINTRYFWLSLYGHNHRVDNNYFSGQNHSGVTLVVWLRHSSDGRHYIGRNYFGQRPRGNANGFETIRIGTGKSSRINANTLVEHNVFEECDGEMEIISNKSNQNVYRYNTFIKSAGTLTIRQGKQVVVANNRFLGEGKKGTGGVRIIGTHHLVYGNYFENLQGRAEGVISITAGSRFDREKGLALYPKVEQTLVAANVLNNNRGANVFLSAGMGSKGRAYLADTLAIVDNLFFRTVTEGPLVDGLQNPSIHWAGNVAFGGQLGYPGSAHFSELKGQKGVAPITIEQAAKSVEYNKKSCIDIVKSLDKSLWPVSLFEGLCARVGDRKNSELVPDLSYSAGVSWAI